ncbi:MAG: hypothetical protein WA816_10560 [Bacteroidales bacterium]
MSNRINIIVLFFFIMNTLNAQLYISVDSNCGNKNSANLAQKLIDTLGEVEVAKLLDNEISIILIFKADKFGNLTFYRSRIRDYKKVVLSPTNSQKIQDDLIEKLSHQLKKNLKVPKGYFILWYGPFPELSDSASYKIISKDLFGDKDYVLINVVFPGELTRLYDLEKEEAEKERKTLSKYDYLIIQIKKYMTPLKSVYVY